MKCVDEGCWPTNKRRVVSFTLLTSFVIRRNKSYHESHLNNIMENSCPASVMTWKKPSLLIVPTRDPLHDLRFSVRFQSGQTKLKHRQTRLLQPTAYQHPSCQSPNPCRSIRCLLQRIDVHHRDFRVASRLPFLLTNTQNLEVFKAPNCTKKIRNVIIEIYMDRNRGFRNTQSHRPGYMDSRKHAQRLPCSLYEQYITDFGSQSLALHLGFW